MKKYQFSLISFILISMLFSQVSLGQTVTESIKDMGGVEQPALIITIEDVKEKTIEQSWSDYMKNYGKKTKRDRKTDILFTDDAHILPIGGADNIDVFMKVEEVSAGHNVIVWLDVDGTFVTTQVDSSQYGHAENFLRDFAFKVKKESLEQDVEEMEKKVKKLDNQLEKLKRDNEGYHKDIIDAREKIAKRENDIEENILDQETTAKELESQNKLLALLKEKLSQHILQKK